MPAITFVGHAGVAVRAGAFRLLADPRLATSGAFLGAWHQYPRNDHLDPGALADAGWVALSHEHLDHFDPWFIERLSARTRILIPRYPGPAFRERTARAAGSRQVIEIAAWEKFALDNRGSWPTVIPELSPMCHDAAFLIVADGRSVLHCNDARLTAAPELAVPLAGPPLYRDPDVHNDHLVGLLKHANAPARRAVEAYETGRDESERIIVVPGGRTYDIPRYCPHAVSA
ncbi:MBL fold metallo-hydrolase [Actinomadura sp. 21ATH]|uniref:MBL fold metallo-hydrolase n=1 Tax=Actinomadura sp. 21ATH TaxID=1735444 RepID=UPI0035C0FA0A